MICSETLPSAHFYGAHAADFLILETRQLLGGSTTRLRLHHLCFVLPTQVIPTTPGPLAQLDLVKRTIAAGL